MTIETGIARAIVNLAAEYGGEQPLALSLGLLRHRRAALHVAAGPGRHHHGRFDRSADHDDGRRAAYDRRDALSDVLRASASSSTSRTGRSTRPSSASRGTQLVALRDRARDPRRARAGALCGDLFPARARLCDLGVRARERPDERRRVPADRASSRRCCRCSSTTRCICDGGAGLSRRRRSSACWSRARARPCSASSLRRSAASKTWRRRCCSSWASACCWSRRRQPQFAAALQPLVAGGWLRTPIAYVLLFGVASPLVLYRGPLNPFGVGIAIFTVLLTAHVLPPVVLVAADHGGGASAERLRPDEYGERVDRKLHRRADRRITKRTLRVSNGGRDRRDVRSRYRLAGALRQTERSRRSSTRRGPTSCCRASTRRPAAATASPIDDDGTALGRAAADAVAAALRDGPAGSRSACTKIPTPPIARASPTRPICASRPRTLR